MPPMVTKRKRWMPVNGPGEASSSSSRGHSGGGGGGGVDPGPAADRLSALPDALLHHVLSFVKAWDAARTCVLSRRWRDLWASAPCVDVRVGRHSRKLPQDYAKFVYRLLLNREALAPVDTLRLRSPNEEDDEDFDSSDVTMWIRHAIRRNARVIQLTGHHNSFAVLDSVDLVSRHLKILKLAYTELSDSLARQLSSRCPSLEELELKNCLVECREIASVSLKRLTMVKCTITENFSVDAPNLVFVQCTAPETWVPVFKNSGALVTGIVMLDDSLLSNEFKKYQEDDDEDPQTSDDDDEDPQTSDDDDDNKSIDACKSVPDSDDSDQMDIGDPGFLDYYYNKHCLPDLLKGNYDYGSGINSDNDNYDYGSDINSDSDTYEYSEIANGYEDKQFGNRDNKLDCTRGSKDHGCSAKHIINDYKKIGGQNVLHSLSNARYLELLGHSGEVILRRESLSCPTFSNLKTLALGEWCISTGADFDILLLLLQHAPSLEKLYLQLEMNCDIQKALGRGIEPKGGSFACKHLSMVKIRCTKDDPRVHMLAQLFSSNGLPFEKIYVRRSGSFYLRNLKLERSITLDELREYES